MPDWTMEYSGPTVMLPFDFGEVEVTFTDEGHCHVSAYSDGSRKGMVTYRSKRWYCSVHLYGKYGWKEQPLRDPETGAWLDGYRHQFTTPDHPDWNYTVPKTYRAAIVTAMTKAVAAYVEEHPEVLPAAQVNSLEHELQRAEEKMAETARAAAEATNEFMQIHRELEKAKGILFSLRALQS